MPSCYDCKRDAPETVSGYALIGSEGWRVTRHMAAHGAEGLAWHCPACWAEQKAAKGFSSGTWTNLVPESERGKRSAR